MTLDAIGAGGLVLIGCGKMGSALLSGWLAQGLAADRVWIIDPNPQDWLATAGVHVNQPLPKAPAVVLIAVKPQMMGDALPSLAAMADGRTLFVSVAAGVTLARYAAVLGADAPVVRTMPNTPAAVGRGITALIGNDRVTSMQLDQAEALMAAVGTTVRLTDEGQIDAVTAVSGSGPAYVFHMIEALAIAAEAEGLPPDLAMQLSRATVTGAGELAHQAPESAAQLRINVTSPNGTTAAALAVLMDADTGLSSLMTRTVAAAARRSRELAQ